MIDDAILTIEKENLPQGWQLKTIPQLVGKDGVFVDGDWVESKDQDPNGEVRLIQLADVGDGQYRNKSQRFLTLKKAKELGCTFLREGDVLIARMPDPLGRACIFPGDTKEAVTVVDVAIARPGKDEFDTKWLMHFVNAPAFRKAVASMEAGSTRKRISRKNLGKILLPVPSLPQQRKIASEIDTQFSRLDEAVTALKQIQANLKRYKAAVLKAAVEGKLTEQWRKEHPDVEPADQLLKRILAERRAKWEAEELDKMKAKGIKPKDDSWKKKYKEPAGPDMANLPELPVGWVWASAEQISDFITKGTTPSATKLLEGGGDVRFLKVYNLTFSGRLNYNFKPTFVDQSVHQGELARSRVVAGDVLINIVGPPLGQVSVVPAEIAEANINQAIARYRPIKGLSNQFLAYTLMADSIISWAIKRAKTTAGQSNLTLELCRDLPIPLPSFAEQNQVVEELNCRLSITEELEATIKINLKRAERLRQSLLLKVFTAQ